MKKLILSELEDLVQFHMKSERYMEKKKINFIINISRNMLTYKDIS